MSISISDNEIFQHESLFTDIPAEFKISVLDCAAESINNGNVTLSRYNKVTDLVSVLIIVFIIFKKVYRIYDWNGYC